MTLDHLIPEGSNFGCQGFIDNNTMDWSVQYIEQGQLKLLLQLLTRKFGPLPSGLKTKLEASDGSTVNKLADALLDMNSIEELKSILD